MKELLEQYFGKHYQSPKQAIASCVIRSGRFSLADSKACGDCQKFTPEHETDCDKVVINVDSGEHNVECIQLEQFIGNYANLKSISSGKKCDLLLVDDERIVFCDMTCSKAKYIDPYMMKDGTEKIGKRNSVRKQIENSISLLQNVPEIASEIKGKSSRRSLFAYRVKDVPIDDNFDSKVKVGMQSFIVNVDKISKEPMLSDMDNGFLFIEIKYPDIFIW